MAYQSIHGSYTYSTPSDQVHSMDSNYTNTDGLPLNQLVMNSDCADMDQPICMGSNGIYSYPLCQVYSQPPSQVIIPSNTGPFDNNNVYTGVNTQLNSAHYGYVDENRVNYSTMNGDLTSYNPPAIQYPLPQTSGQIPPTPTRSNNAAMTTNATSHGYVIIIVKADINLERLLSIIQ
ncbi:5183_t:CDS:1 [Paraglomus brasilianum]|uniref:5183_t:CDS:1 n=1 Tax=Paraglomus brasilianum TaxID=144538 RepID=A0A9N9CTQ0_9GLOM|nr:5183_t:CDS:1 [Paraglomus brasilianum]